MRKNKNAHTHWRTGIRRQQNWNVLSNPCQFQWSTNTPRNKEFRSRGIFTTATTFIQTDTKRDKWWLYGFLRCVWNISSYFVWVRVRIMLLKYTISLNSIRFDSIQFMTWIMILMKACRWHTTMVMVMRPEVLNDCGLFITGINVHNHTHIK